MDTLSLTLKDIKKCFLKTEKKLRWVKVEHSALIDIIDLQEGERRTKQAERDSLPASHNDHKASPEKKKRKCKLDFFMAWSSNMQRFLQPYSDQFQTSADGIFVTRIPSKRVWGLDGIVEGSSTSADGFLLSKDVSIAPNPRHVFILSHPVLRIFVSPYVIIFSISAKRECRCR